jgi:hypothetical protein
MFRAHRVLFLLAALVFPCAQGCRTSAGATQATLTPEPPLPSATPTPSAPPFPALKRGDEAFEPFNSLSGGRSFESRAVERKPARKDLKVSADYPVLVGDVGAAAREFNRRTRAFVVGDVTPYLEAGRDLEKEKNPNWKDVEEFHNVSHKVVYASDEVVSVLFYVEGYSWGAGHSYHHPVTFNFDLKTGREIKLAQLFKPGSGYLRTISDLCTEDLEHQYAQQLGQNHPFGQGPTLLEGLQPKPENFKSWVVTPGGLVFIFEEYQVVSYADGEPKVLIPFDHLKEFLNPRGALTRLAAHE